MTFDNSHLMCFGKFNLVLGSSWLRGPLWQCLHGLTVLDVPYSLKMTAFRVYKVSFDILILGYLRVQMS